MSDLQIEFNILNDNLTRTQEECTRLLLENRKLVAMFKEQSEMTKRAQDSWDYWMKRAIELGDKKDEN